MSLFDNHKIGFYHGGGERWLRDVSMVRKFPGRVDIWAKSKNEVWLNRTARRKDNHGVGGIWQVMLLGLGWDEQDILRVISSIWKKLDRGFMLAMMRETGRKAGLVQIAQGFECSPMLQDNRQWGTILGSWSRGLLGRLI